MPMYYPDLTSVRKIAESMSKNTPGKEYKGIIPKSNKELPQARKELGKYFREVWKDEVAAIEVENAVTEESYYKQMSDAMAKQIEGLI